jgi:hypothetical protein
MRLARDIFSSKYRVRRMRVCDPWSGNFLETSRTSECSFFHEFTEYGQKQTVQEQYQYYEDYVIVNVFVTTSESTLLVTVTSSVSPAEPLMPLFGVTVFGIVGLI